MRSATMFVFILICCLLPAVLKADTACELLGGTCLYTSEVCSGGQFWRGKCNGPINRQCCIPDSQSGDTQCELQSGTCKYSRERCSGGMFWKGKCNGPVNQKCCIPDSQSGDCKCVYDEGGFCQIDSNPCSGIYKAGKCAGASNRKCCIPSSAGGTGSSQASSQLKIGQLCKSNPTNELRGCDGDGCGHYGACRKRSSGPGPHEGVDVKCTEGDDVYAPFPGKVIRVSRPYKKSHSKFNSCCNTGFQYKGTGEWSDYKFKLWYVSKLNRTGIPFNKGDVIAKHEGLGCCYGSSMTDHTHFQLENNGKIIDPTNMVTG